MMFGCGTGYPISERHIQYTKRIESIPFFGSPALLRGGLYTANETPVLMTLVAGPSFPIGVQQSGA